MSLENHPIKKRSDELSIGPRDPSSDTELLHPQLRLERTIRDRLLAPDAVTVEAGEAGRRFVFLTKEQAHFGIDMRQAPSEPDGHSPREQTVTVQKVDERNLTYTEERFIVQWPSAPEAKGEVYSYDVGVNQQFVDSWKSGKRARGLFLPPQSDERTTGLKAGTQTVGIPDDKATEFAESLKTAEVNKQLTQAALQHLQKNGYKQAPSGVVELSPLPTTHHKSIGK